MRIASDVPNEIIEIMNMIDYGRIPARQHDELLMRLDALASKHIKKKNRTPYYVNASIPGCPLKLADLISSYDFAALSKFQKTMAIPFIRGYVRKNLPLKH